jgi:CRISPR/Cas system CMR-associated protein Cmr5 small subunit
MNTVKAFKSKDGKLFDSKEKCINHECISEIENVTNAFIDGQNAQRDSEEQIDIDNNVII